MTTKKIKGMDIKEYKHQDYLKNRNKIREKYKKSKYDVIDVLIQDEGILKPENKYRVIKIKGDYKRSKIWYILEVKKNDIWYELRRSIHYDVVKSEYWKWVKGDIIS